tara:strand:+ start:960 stop:1208 length:249 start_codon:yes stop_codon:yes gene_type:complete
MKKFKVSKYEEYEMEVDVVAKSLAKADIAVQASFIADFFGGMDNKTVETLAKRIAAKGFHRGDKELEMLCAAIKYSRYQDGN